MKKIVILVSLLLAGCSLFGCATGAKFTEVQPKMVAESPGMSRIFFYRTSVLGAALQPEVLLNDHKVGKAVAQGFFYVDRSPGNYIVATSTEVERKLSFTLEQGQTRYVRFSVSMGFFAGHVYGKLVDNSVALEEIKDCKYIEDKKD
jgi:hypothetical protein